MAAAKAAPIWVTGALTLDPAEIEESFVRSTGPGGQHVNTTSTAVQLRFDVRHSPSLTDDVRHRLERLAGRRLTRDGVLVLMAQGQRSQKRNREEALDRLVEAGGCEVVLQFGHVGILRFMVVNAAFNDETRHSGLDPESSGLFLDTGVRRYDELEGTFHINRVRTGSVPGSARIH